MAFKNKIMKVIKNKCIIVCIIVSVVIILDADLRPDFNFMLWGPVNISCHYIDNNNVIPELGKGYKPKARSIFFHETSCEGNLTSIQSCAVESAARAHPDWDIYVLFSSPLRKLALEQGSLKECKNDDSKHKRLHNGNAIGKIVLGGALNKSRWTIEHTSDVLLYLTLYKWGGVYMDLDFVVVRSVASLDRNWAARENNRWVSAGILSFSRDAVGKNIANAAIRDLSSRFRGDLYSYNGSKLVTRTLRNICSTNDVTAMTSVSCNGFQVYGPQFFFPLPWERSEEFFWSGDLDVQNVFMAHTYNHRTKKSEPSQGFSLCQVS